MAAGSSKSSVASRSSESSARCINPRSTPPSDEPQQRVVEGVIHRDTDSRVLGQIQPQLFLQGILRRPRADWRYGHGLFASPPHRGPRRSRPPSLTTDGVRPRRSLQRPQSAAHVACSARKECGTPHALKLTGGRANLGGRQVQRFGGPSEAAHFCCGEKDWWMSSGRIGRQY